MELLFFVLVPIGVVIFMLPKKQQTGCLVMFGTIVLVCILATIVIAIIETNMSPEEKQKRAEAQQERQQHEEWSKGQEARDNETRKLIEAGKQIEDYKRIHGHYPE